MPKLLTDTKCDKCGYSEEDIWYDTQEREDLSNADVLCGVCGKGTVKIVLGRPQFTIRGEGVYDQGKH